MERIAPMIKFDYRGVSVKVRGVRQESPPKMLSINYEIIVDSDETERKLALMHDNIRKYGTVYNTVALGTELTGTLRRAQVFPGHVCRRLFVGQFFHVARKVFANSGLGIAAGGQVIETAGEFQSICLAIG